MKSFCFFRQHLQIVSEEEEEEDDDESDSSSVLFEEDEVPEKPKKAPAKDGKACNACSLFCLGYLTYCCEVWWKMQNSKPSAWL